MAMSAEYRSKVMVTSPYEWKILECDGKPQTNKQTNKQTRNLYGDTELFFSFKNIHHFKLTNETTQLFSFLLYGTIHLFG